MSNNQTRFVAAVANYKISSRGIVEIYEEMLQEYAVNLLTSDLEFAINALAEFPRLQRKAVEITKFITGAKVVMPEGQAIWTVDAEKLSKKAKAAIRSKIDEFVALELSSLLNWERESKEKVAKFDALASQKKIKQAIEKQIKDGLSVTMAIGLLEQMLNDLRSDIAVESDDAE